jgi:hypothetical protein
MPWTNRATISSTEAKTYGWEPLLNQTIFEIEAAEAVLSNQGSGDVLDNRKASGSYYTPTDVADHFWIQFFRFHQIKSADDFRHLIARSHFVEPSAGAGIFVFTFIRQAMSFGLSIQELAQLHFSVIDVNFAALQFVHHKLVELETEAAFHLPHVGMVQQDFLQWSTTTKSTNVIFVGNPPFVTNQRGARWRNMYADFVEAMLNFQSASVSFSLILPVSVCFSRDYAGLRCQLQNSGMGLSAASYDNIPDCLFKAGKPESQNTNRANSQRCTILHVGGPDSSVRESSPMIRWNARNRGEVLLSLPDYHDWSNYVFDSQIPRPSTDWMLKYLSENKSSPTLRSHMTRHAKSDFAVGAVARNFIGIREPSLGDASSILIKAETELDRMVLLQILGSSIFFEYWRSLGDGFHVTSDLIERFPISERLYKCCLANSSSAKYQWNNRAQVLKEKLNSGRVVRTFDFTGCFDYLEI